LLLFLLGGCGGQAPNDADAFADLLREGTLAAIDLQAKESLYRRAQVTRSDLIFPWQSSVGLVFPDTYIIAFEITDRVWHEARLRHGLAARIGDEIQAGQFIAELFYDDNTLLEIHRRELNFERLEFERWFADEQARFLIETAVLRQELETAENWEQTALRLSRRELEHTLFLRESARRREGFAEREEALAEQYRGERLYAPADGIVTHITTAADGDLFRDIPYVWAQANSPGFGIMTLTDDTALYFTVQGRRDVYRYGKEYIVRSMLAGGPSFYVELANDPLIFPVSRDGTEEIILIPSDKAAFADELASHSLRPWDLRNIDFIIEAPLVLALDAITVPAEAVHSENQRAFVFVYDEGIVLPLGD
jgi:hypothetical protein